MSKNCVSVPTESWESDGICKSNRSNDASPVAGAFRMPQHVCAHASGLDHIGAGTQQGWGSEMSHLIRSEHI
jgi:hypothetical protein